MSASIRPIAMALALQAAVASGVSAEEKFRSHPPLRPNPSPAHRPRGDGPAYFVDCQAGDDAHDGSESRPWKTLARAVKRLTAGDTLYLRGGTYFENVYVSVDGTPERPIVIRSFPGELAVIDGGIPEFQLAPRDMWEPVHDGGAGEFRSTRAYPNIRDVVGAFGDSDIGLQTYWHLRDLRSPHELSAPGDDGDLQSQYCGPGLYYDRHTGRIHARLAHTHFRHFENYAGETDPRKLPLVVAPFRSTPLWVDQASHVHFQDLIIRGGGYETTRVTSAVHVEFDNVTIRGGTYCMRTENTGPFRFYRSAMYGNAPPWSFRADGSLRSRPGRNTRDIARLTCHALWVADTGREFSVYAFPLNDDWEVAYSDFTDSHDGLYLGGISVRFHHNLIDCFQDDGIYLSPMYPRHHYLGSGARIEIFGNLFTRALTPIAFGGTEDTRDEVYIYRNVFDLRGGVNYARPSQENPDVQPYATTRVFSDHGSPPWPAMNIYHNTFVALGGKIDLGALAGLRTGHPRAVLNNIFFNFGGLGSLQPPSAGLGQEDGNLYWSPGQAKAAESFFDRYRSSPAFAESQRVYPPGFTANSLAADPRFLSAVAQADRSNDYRLRPDSPAVAAGVALPDAWPDSHRRHAGRPDIGALPLDADPPAFGRAAASAPGSAAP